MKSRTEILVPLAAIQAVPIQVIAWYRLHRYAWYRYSAIVNSINEEIRRKITKEGKCQKLRQQDRGQNLLKANNYSVNINNTGVNLSYSLLDDANISYGVYTQDGIFLVNRKLGKQKQGKYNMAIDLGYVNKKNLIFTLFVNGIPYSKVIGENVQ